MNLIARLISIGLEQCQDRGVIDWTPTDGAPLTFYAECEIEHSLSFTYQDHIFWNGDWFVTLCGVLCIIDATTLECWHSSKIAETIEEIS